MRQDDSDRILAEDEKVEMEKLSEMPNIWKGFEKKLQQAGINTPGELSTAGSRNTFLRISAFDAGACLSMLCAMEGAVRGIRWHNLPADVKA